MIAENVSKLREEIRSIAHRCGRDPGAILLLAVSKSFPAGHVSEAVGAGILDFGENYVQELQGKQAALSDPRIRWHFIGHLQTNKVKNIIGTVQLIHSVDNLRLAAELQKRARGIDRLVDVLVEVHTTDEPTKFGVAPEETSRLVRELANHDRLRVRGLMTMGPFSDRPDDSRPSFRTLRQLRDAIVAERIPGATMEHLSMGMTHDFGVAIEEGATILRIGTAIFGRRPQRQ